MSEEFLAFGSGRYWVLLAVLIFARGMDVLSTWVATPNLVLEGNPIAKKLGWSFGLPINFSVCLLLAFWPLPAIVISTTSLLVAARNFQSAWLMRSMGEEIYRDWHVRRIQETRITLYLWCLAGNTVLTAAIGGAVAWFNRASLVPFAIGMGIIAYAAAVAFYTLLAIWRMRRASIAGERLRARNLLPNTTPAAGSFVSFYVREDAPGK